MNDEFIALGRGLRRHPKKKLPICKKQTGSWMHRQSTDDWALRLHSCRALSSQPQDKDRSWELHWQTQEIEKCVTYVPGRKCYLCIGTFTFGTCPGVSSQAPQPPANFWQPFGLAKATEGSRIRIQEACGDPGFGYRGAKHPGWAGNMSRLVATAEWVCRVLPSACRIGPPVSEPCLARPHDRLGPVGDLELGENIGDKVPNGLWLEPQAARN